VSEWELWHGSSASDEHGQIQRRRRRSTCDTGTHAGSENLCAKAGWSRRRRVRCCWCYHVPPPVTAPTLSSRSGVLSRHLFEASSCRTVPSASLNPITVREI